MSVPREFGGSLQAGFATLAALCSTRPTSGFATGMPYGTCSFSLAVLAIFSPCSGTRAADRRKAAACLLLDQNRKVCAVLGPGGLPIVQGVDRSDQFVAGWPIPQRRII